MTQEIKSAWPAAVIVGVVLLIALVYGLSAINSNVKNLETPNVDLTSVVNAIDTNSEKIDLLIISQAFPSTEYTLTKGEYEKDVIEAKALELATEFTNSKEFKKLVFNALVVSNETIESYKHITQIKFGDTDVSCSDTCIIDFEDVKVYYYVDGDDEETEKALLEDFKVEVNDVDFDDEFVDAEVKEDLTLEISKVY